MIAEIRQLLAARPFQPFSVLTNGGWSYFVPTGDHTSISPEGNRLVIWFDEGGSIILSGLHVTSIEMGEAANA